MTDPSSRLPSCASLGCTPPLPPHPTRLPFPLQGNPSSLSPCFQFLRAVPLPKACRAFRAGVGGNRRHSLGSLSSSEEAGEDAREPPSSALGDHSPALLPFSLGFPSEPAAGRGRFSSSCIQSSCSTFLCLPAGSRLAVSRAIGCC